MKLHSKNWIIPIVGIFMLIFSTLNAQIIFVKQGATGTGTSWADASGNLKAALDVAQFGTQIWVAEGTYTTINCTSCTYNDRILSFNVKDGVKLYGGFAGTETSLDDRNFEIHPTVLSGDIDGDGTNINNSYSIIFTQWVTDETEIDGFIVTSGNADFPAALGNSANSGAGLYNNGSLMGLSSHPIIRNCTFSNCQAWGFGGAVYNDGAFNGAANPTFINCRFENNTAQNAGGAMYNSGIFDGAASPVLKDCFFENNHSVTAQGGALFNSGASQGNSSPELTDCIFKDNTSGVSGGAVFNFANQTGLCEAKFTNCLFENNLSLIGGALYNDGSFWGQCNPVLDNCVFQKNHSTDGDAGAVYNSGIENGTVNPIFNHCTFKENESSGAGGAMFSNGVLGSTEPELTNCFVYANIAGTFGGGIYNMGKEGNASPILTNCLIYNNIALSSAGGMYNLGADNGNSSPIITNCTFYGNKADIGGAIYNNASAPNGNSSPIITNTIIWGNKGFGHIFRNILGTPEISFSLVDAVDCEATNSSNGMGQTICGDGMIYNLYPEFQDTAATNFHLKEMSPAVDVGDNAAINAVGMGIDLDSLPRIFAGVVDFGPYEYGSFIDNSPVITNHPNGQEICEASEVIFTVNATAPVDLFYQWQKDGLNISGETSDSLTISNSDVGNSGDYSCLVFNNEGDTVSSNIAVLTVIELQEVLVSVTASVNEICEGEPVIFTAIPENEGSNPTFEWFLNGNAFGGNIPSFTSTDLNDGDELYCVLTSNADCIIDPVATSNSVQITVNEIVEATVFITSNATAICEGETIEFLAEFENGGSNPTFQWQINGQNVGTNQPSFGTNNLNDGDIISCILTSNADCILNPTTSSNSIQITVNEIVEASISIQASETQICENETVLFQAFPENGGANPTFQWQINGQNVGTNLSNFTSNTLNDNDVITCILTSNAECISNPNTISNAVEMTVGEIGVAMIEIEADATEICQSEPVHFTANIENGGTNPNFQWFLNGNAFGENASQIIASNLNDGDIITCTLTSDADCVSNPTANSNSLIISVIDVVNASVSVEALQSEICEGEASEFTAIPVHGGMNPVFQWFVNSVLVQDGGQNFTTSNLNSSDIVTCQMTSDLDCVAQTTVISDGVSVMVLPFLNASISIDSDVNEICEGEEITFNSAIENGGVSPEFEWQINGNFAGNMSEFSTSFLNDGDMVSCILTSSENCISNNPVTSNDIQITVNPFVTPTLEIQASFDSTICLGDTVSFYADFENGGDNPVFEWTINNNTAGGNFAEFTTDQLENFDEVFCTLISDEECLTTNNVTSNIISVSVDSCTVGNKNTFLQFVDFHIYPNPSFAGFWIEINNLDKESILEIADLTGKIHLRKPIPTSGGSYLKFQETDVLASGIYLVRLRNEKGILIRKAVFH